MVAIFGSLIGPENAWPTDLISFLNIPLPLEKETRVDILKAGQFLFLLLTLLREAEGSLAEGNDFGGVAAGQTDGVVLHSELIKERMEGSTSQMLYMRPDTFALIFYKEFIEFMDDHVII